MVSLDVIKGIVGNSKVIVVGGNEWGNIVKLVPNTEAGFNFLSGGDLFKDSIFDLLSELNIEVVYEE